MTEVEKTPIKILSKDRDFYRFTAFTGVDYRVLAWPLNGARLAAISWARSPPNTGAIPHAHASSEEFVFIIQGHGYIEDENGKRYNWGPGDLLFYPPGTKHKIWSTGPEDMIAVSAQVPADFLFFSLDKELKKALDEYVRRL